MTKKIYENSKLKSTDGFKDLDNGFSVKLIKKKYLWSEKEIDVRELTDLEVLSELKKTFSFKTIPHLVHIENARGCTQLPMKYVFYTDKEVSHLEGNTLLRFEYLEEFPDIENLSIIEVDDYILNRFNSSYLNKKTQWYLENCEGKYY